MESFAVTNEPLARQMDPFAVVFDGSADYLCAPAMPSKDLQGGIRIAFGDEDAKADTHIVDFEHLGRVYSSMLLN